MVVKFKKLLLFVLLLNIICAKFQWHVLLCLLFSPVIINGSLLSMFLTLWTPSRLFHYQIDRRLLVLHKSISTVLHASATAWFLKARIIITSDLPPIPDCPLKSKKHIIRGKINEIASCMSCKCLLNNCHCHVLRFWKPQICWLYWMRLLLGFVRRDSIILLFLLFINKYNQKFPL